MGCHQYDGSGLPPDVPSLRDDLSYLIGSPAGRDFMLRVPGVIGAPGSAEEVADLLNWTVDTFYQGETDSFAFYRSRSHRGAKAADERPHQRKTRTARDTEMLSLKDRLLLRAGFCLMVLSAGWTSPVAAEQERVNLPLSLTCCTAQAVTLRMARAIRQKSDLRKNLDKLLQSATGRGYMLRVPGVTDTPITPQEMADLMNWLITEFYPELEDFRLISAEEVIRGRATRLANPLEVRQTLLDAAKD